MPSVFSLVSRLAPSRYVLWAVLLSAAGIGLLLGFILLRRVYRHRYFQRLNRRMAFLRNNWEGVTQGIVPTESWWSKTLDREMVESILLDQLENANPTEADRLTKFLRSSGLLDRRLFEARKYRGGRRRNALLSLGRMRVPEVIPVLSEALEDPDGETRLIAIRSLGRTGLLEAAEPIVQYVLRGLPDVAATTVQNALLRCCQERPAILLPYIARADDAVRPLLARVLGEFASADIADDLILLTTDKVAEVRASAARSLGFSKSAVAIGALARLIEDPDWFVRLRAVAAMGQMNDPRAIPPLVAALCDENRLVRLRTAEVLSRFERQLPEILRAVMLTRDEYALQAFISQIERVGAIPKLINALGDAAKQSEARKVLMNLLKSGAHRMLLDALAHHPVGRIRAAVARLVAQSDDERLLPQLDEPRAAQPSEEQEVIQLHGHEAQKKVPV
jgi:HEAT repeat protein